jgi:predicted adenine nucleotide alpha hydrolase (AANH) superfamily ATPase
MPRSKILVHICCGPCAIYPVQELLDQDFEVVGLFFNPNIHPLKEYLRRREALQEVSQRLGIQIIYLDKEYSPQNYFREIAFREANRCFHCYQIRLQRTLSVARRGKFDFFSSTLLYSKFQKHEQIAALARDIAGGGQTGFWYQDFRQGWQKGIQKSKEWGIYRQEYCGCVYSENERYIKELQKLQH